jgi:hypothetical protein
MDGMVQGNGSAQLVGKGRHAERLGTQDKQRERTFGKGDWAK